MFNSNSWKIFIGFLSPRFHIFAEPEEVTILKGEAFKATLATVDSRRLSQVIMGPVIDGNDS
jgi:hypothetical protein